MKTLLATIFVLGLVAGAGARAAFKNKIEMIRSADAIAIVTIGQTEKAEMTGRGFTFRQKAHATVRTVLKGELPKQVALYGDEDFICARCVWAKGEYLVFLRKAKDLWAGANWHLSARKIEGDEVVWFGKPEPHTTARAKLDDVVKEICQILKTPSRDRGVDG